MKFAASTSAFDRALSVEIAASEQVRMRVLAGTLAILLLGDQLLFLFARETSLFGIMSWRCWAQSEHGIARPRTWHALGGFRQCGTESQ
jgi:hypothetical protein